MKCENFVLAAEIPFESKFATKFASDCECDGVVHSGLGDCPGGLQDAEHGLLVVHICWCTLGALLFSSFLSLFFGKAGI